MSGGGGSFRNDEEPPVSETQGTGRLLGQGAGMVGTELNEVEIIAVMSGNTASVSLGTHEIREIDGAGAFAEGADLHVEKSQHVSVGCEHGGFPTVFQGNEADTGRSLAEHAEIFCGSPRKINDAAVHKRAAVIDAHFRYSAVFQIDDAQPGTEGQKFVGCRHGVLVVAFAVGGRLAVEARAVPGGDARFHEIPGGFQRVVGFSAHRVRAGSAVTAVLISGSGGTASDKGRHDEKA